MARRARFICCGASILLASSILAACTSNVPPSVTASTPLPSSTHLPTTLPNGELAYKLTVGGLSRAYEVHIPSSTGDRAGLPVVFLFHGRGGTAERMRDIAHFDATSNQNGFLAVYPEGYLHTWNDGVVNTPAKKAGIDDVAFVTAMIRQLVVDHKIDRTRVFATGLSNGGIFTERLGCQLAGMITAIAPVAGTMPSYLARICHPGRPMPVLEIHGTSDPLVPFRGGQLAGGRLGGPMLSVHDTIASWRAVDSCSGSPVTTQLPRRPSDPTSTTVETSASCAGGSSVVLYTVNGGGHTWPGGQQYLPVRLIGATTRTFDASQTIWDFFATVPHL
jgi:polyhydroxybutyrate depolymerase